MTRRPAEPAPVLVTQGLVFASVAIGVATLLAVLAGALRGWVIAVAVVVGLVAGILAGRATASDGDPGGRQRIVQWFRSLTPLESLALLAFALVSIRQFGWLTFESRGVIETLIPYNYGDLPLHWTYVQYLASGAPFWPENPIVSGMRLRYPFGVDLLTALFVVAGLGVRLLLAVLGLAGAALTAVTLCRWGGALAVAGVLFSGGLAGFRILWTGALADYQSSVAWKNLYLALFVPQRGLLLALPVGLLLLWSWRRRLLRGEPGLVPWVEGVLWGVMPLVHLHTFLVLSLFYAAWALGGGRLKEAWATLGWAIVPATWAVWQVSDGFRAASLVGWKPGWTIGEENPLVFLAVNFGLFLPLAVWALVAAWRGDHREDLLVLAPALGLFASLFIVRLAPWEWDNTKVMLWCYVLILPSIGSLVLSRLGRAWRAVAVAGLFFSGAVSVTAASLGGGRRLDILRPAEYEAVCQALSSRPPGERVAVAPTFNHPVALCGHPVVLGYAGHVWSHGIDASAVGQHLDGLMRGEPTWREDAKAVHARLLFWGRAERLHFGDSTRPWEQELAPIASGPWGALYDLTTGD